MIRSPLGVLLLGLALVGCSPAAEQQDTTPSLGQASSPDQNTYPVGLRIPDIGVDSHDPWVPLGIQGAVRVDGTKIPVVTKAGEIEVPDVHKPLQLGWYCPYGISHCGAPVPGQVGPAVVIGHINGDHKNGIFARLAAKDAQGRYLIHPGSKIEVDRSDNRTFVFTVTELQVGIPKDQFPTDKVYSDTGGPTIRLITCGPYDLDRTAHNYRDQTIVYGTLDSVRLTR